MRDPPAPDRGFQTVRRYCAACNESRWFEWRPASNQITLVTDRREVPPPRFGWYCATCGYHVR